jgi:mRNA-degrading endonuclease RelE of RelBE toxin-antitoxin system
MDWNVQIVGRAKKQAEKLPANINDNFLFLVEEMKVKGCNLPHRPHFGKIEKNTYHCHLNKGHPTYVVCWEVKSKKEKKIEVYYVGTHENAPY